MATMEIKDFLKLIYSSMALDLIGDEKKITIDVEKFIEALAPHRALPNVQPKDWQHPLHKPTTVEGLVEETFRLATGQIITDEHERDKDND